MQRWQIDEETQGRILDHLTNHRFIDEERFCRAFAKDKIRYNKWGRRKVEQALLLKRIPIDIQRKVLGEIDEQEYLDVLLPLLASKRKDIQGKNAYERNGKLMRFALQRGFTMDIIRRCMEEDGRYEDD